MQIVIDQLKAVFIKVFKDEFTIDADVPLMDSGLRLDSLRIVRLLVEIEELLGQPLPQESAFELFGLSLNQMLDALNAMRMNGAAHV